MQTRIVEADARTAASLTHRLTDVLDGFSMLGRCTAPGCITTIFGQGTCVAHDPPRLHPTDIPAKQHAAAGQSFLGRL